MDVTVEQFRALVQEFERNPTADLLRQLEALARQILPRLATLGAASLLAFQEASTVLVAALLSPVGIGILATAGVLGVTVAWWYLVLNQIATALEATRLARTETIAEAARIVIARALIDMGFAGRTSREFDPCWDDFTRDLENALFTHGFQATPALRRAFDEALKRLLLCLFSDAVVLADFQLSRAQNIQLRNLLITLIRRYFPTVLAGVVGLAAGAEEAEAAQPTVAELEELVRRTGLRGVHRSDGFGYCEFDDAPPSDRPVTYGDVNVAPNLPLDAFTGAELEARQRALSRMIEEIEREIAAAEEELTQLGANPEADTHRSDLLRLRAEALRREAERLRAALQNANAESQRRGREPLFSGGVRTPFRPAAGEADREERPPIGVSAESATVGSADQPRAAGWKVRRLPNGLLEYTDGATIMLWDSARMRWEPIAWGGTPPDPNPINPRTGERMAGVSAL